MQRCNTPKVRRLVTIGSQHQGVASIPGCVEGYQRGGVEGNGNDNTPIDDGRDSIDQRTGHPSNMLCMLWESVLSAGIYAQWVQEHVIQAQYYKNSTQMHQYFENNTFLKDINLDTKDPSTKDEHDDVKREAYRRNILDLEMFVMVKFVPDGLVVPGESAWFGWWNGERVVPLEEQNIYGELGLKQLDESGRLKRVVREGVHMMLDEQWLKDLTKAYLIV